MPNRKAIVVGASRGIGRSIALTLARAGGWDVGLMARSVAALQSVARECAAVNKHCTVVVAPSDVCHPTAHAKAMQEIAEREMAKFEAIQSELKAENESVIYRAQFARILLKLRIKKGFAIYEG